MVADGSRARARMDNAVRLMLRAVTPREQPVSPRVRSASTGGALGLALEASPRSGSANCRLRAVVVLVVGLCLCRCGSVSYCSVVGLRWTIEECFESAKDDLGLDHCEAR